MCEVLANILATFPHRVLTVALLTTVLLEFDAECKISQGKSKREVHAWCKFEAEKLRTLLAYVRKLRRRSGTSTSCKEKVSILKSLVELRISPLSGGQAEYGADPSGASGSGEEEESHMDQGEADVSAEVLGTHPINVTNGSVQLPSSSSSSSTSGPSSPSSDPAQAVDAGLGSERMLHRVTSCLSVASSPGKSTPAPEVGLFLHEALGLPARDPVVPGQQHTLAQASGPKGKSKGETPPGEKPRAKRPRGAEHGDGDEHEGRQAYVCTTQQAANLSCSCQ